MNFVKLFHGIGIGWNGRKMVHFTSNFNYNNMSDNVYSIFVDANRGVKLKKRLTEKRVYSNIVEVISDEEKKIMSSLL